MSNRLFVGEQWDQFGRAIMPEGAPLAQRQDMRRAFYAGAQCILFSLIDKLAPGDEPTDADLEMMSDIQREFSDFAELVKNGRA